MNPIKFAALKYLVSILLGAIIMFALGVSGFTMHPVLASVIGILIILLLSEAVEVCIGRNPDSRTRMGELDA